MEDTVEMAQGEGAQTELRNGQNQEEDKSKLKQHKLYQASRPEILLKRASNPYIECLSVMRKSVETSKGRMSGPCYDYLRAMLSLRDADDPSVSKFHLTYELKKQALATAFKQKNKSFIDLVCIVFEIDGSQASEFRPAVEEIIAQGRFVEAARIAVYVGLCTEFVVELSLPLAVLDNITLLDTCVEKSVYKQDAVVSTLDHYYENPVDVDAAISMCGLKPIKDKEALWKRMGKFIVRLLKKYKLSPEFCPRLRYSRNISTLRYLLRKKYRDRDISEHSWRELILALVCDFSEIHGELLRLLTGYGDLQEAYYFAVTLSIGRSLWPHKLIKFAATLSRQPPCFMAWHPLLPFSGSRVAVKSNGCRWGPPSTGVTLGGDARNTNGVYLTLDPSLANQVYFVWTLHEFRQAVKVLARATLIGIDAEWKPAMGFMHQTRLSLFQLASREAVFLFDVLKLINLASKDDWEKLFSCVFDDNTTVVGYGSREDLRKLHELTDVEISTKSFVDLCTAQVALTLVRPDLMKPCADLPSNVLQANNTGLSKLTMTLLGYPLDKAEQCSDWENRPLRHSQINYAALDAHCLIRCWDELRNRCAPEDLREVIQDANLRKAAMGAPKSKNGCSSTISAKSIETLLSQAAQDDEIDVQEASLLED